MGRKTVAILEDFDIQDAHGRWIKSWSTPTGIAGVYEQHRTLSSCRWNRINSRSNPNGREQRKNPTYIGTQNHFADFNEFVEWSRSEVGYNLKEETIKGIKNWAIDKDILSKGNKIYSPSTCLFVPTRVNTLIVSCGAARGEFPIGVYYISVKNRYTAECRTDKKSKYLGCFTDPMEAHRAWQKAKITFGRTVADEYKNFHRKLYEGLNSWCDSIQNDYDNYRETKF